MFTLHRVCTSTRENYRRQQVLTTAKTPIAAKTEDEESRCRKCMQVRQIRSVVRLRTSWESAQWLQTASSSNSKGVLNFNYNNWWALKTKVFNCNFVLRTCQLINSASRILVLLAPLYFSGSNNFFFIFIPQTLLIKPQLFSHFFMGYFTVFCTL